MGQATDLQILDLIGEAGLHAWNPRATKCLIPVCDTVVCSFSLRDKPDLAKRRHDRKVALKSWCIAPTWSFVSESLAPFAIMELFVYSNNQDKRLTGCGSNYEKRPFIVLKAQRSLFQRKARKGKNYIHDWNVPSMLVHLFVVVSFRVHTVTL